MRRDELINYFCQFTMFYSPEQPQSLLLPDPPRLPPRNRQSIRTMMITQTMEPALKSVPILAEPPLLPVKNICITPFIKTFAHILCGGAYNGDNDMEKLRINRYLM